MPATRPMVCAHVRDVLPDYMDDELDAADAAAIAAHLSSCTSCCVELEHARGVVRDLRRRVRDIRMPLEARRRLWTMLLEEAERLDEGGGAGAR